MLQLQHFSTISRWASLLTSSPQWCPNASFYTTYGFRFHNWKYTRVLTITTCSNNFIVVEMFHSILRKRHLFPLPLYFEDSETPGAIEELLAFRSFRSNIYEFSFFRYTKVSSLIFYPILACIFNGIVKILFMTLTFQPSTAFSQSSFLFHFLIFPHNVFT